MHVLPPSMPRPGRTAGASPVVPDPVTPRELEVLEHLKLGRTNAQIAYALSIGIETVRTHTRNIYRKLGVSSRHEVTALVPFVDVSPTVAGPRRAAASG